MPEASQKLPVLILGFNRPELTSQVIRAVKQYSPSRVYLACDGPKGLTADSDEKVFAVRDVMLDADFTCQTFTRFEETNRGLRTAVTNAIDWFFSNEPEGIILEDDCLPSEGFFAFCEMILNRYRDDPRVWGACGYNPTGISFADSSYGFIRFAMIWGWASWADRWAKYDRDLVKYREKALTGNFEWPSRSLYHGLDWHLRQELKIPKSWAYRLSWAVTANNGLWAMPDKNLTKNLGFGENATNTQRQMFANQELEVLSDLRHPVPVQHDSKAENLFLFRHLRVYRFEMLNLARNFARALKRRLANLKGH